MGGDERRPGPNGWEKADRVVGWVVTVAVLIQYADAVSGGRVRLYVRGLAERGRQLAEGPRRPEPSPAELSAMHREAQAITRQAADDGEGPGHG
jgi:hypothetical protein